MKKRPSQTRSRRTLVLALLSLTMTLNSSQVTTLCVRSDGQVVLEPVVHGHCTCETESSGVNTDSALAGVTSYLADEHCGPCVDLSIPLGSCNARTASATPKMAFGGLSAVLPASLLVTSQTAEIASPDPPPEPARLSLPLDSIVLNV
jgi:hypothetical protein